MTRWVKEHFLLSACSKSTKRLWKQEGAPEAEMEWVLTASWGRGLPREKGGRQELHLLPQKSCLLRADLCAGRHRYLLPLRPPSPPPSPPPAVGQQRKEGNARANIATTSAPPRGLLTRPGRAPRRASTCRKPAGGGWDQLAGGRRPRRSLALHVARTAASAAAAPRRPRRTEIAGQPPLMGSAGRLRLLVLLTLLLSPPAGERGARGGTGRDVTRGTCAGPARNRRWAASLARSAPEGSERETSARGCCCRRRHPSEHLAPGTQPGARDAHSAGVPGAGGQRRRLRAGSRRARGAAKLGAGAWECEVGGCSGVSPAGLRGGARRGGEDPAWGSEAMPGAEGGRGRGGHGGAAGHPARQPWLMEATPAGPGEERGTRAQRGERPSWPKAVDLWRGRRSWPGISARELWGASPGVPLP